MLNQVFISYRHESAQHSNAVLRLGKLLRHAGLPVMLDQFFLDENPGGPDVGWPKWCEEHAIQSRCVIIIASVGWFDSYEKFSQSDFGLGAATEADVFRQTLWDEKGNNSRIRIVMLDETPVSKIPVRLRAWHRFTPFESDGQLNLLVRWLAAALEINEVRQPTVEWPKPISFQPDLADRSLTEWPAISDLLTGTSRQRILLIEGASGVGKSELVRQGIAFTKHLGIAYARIDFKGGMLSVDDVLGLLDLELGKYLPNFSRGDGNKTVLLRKDLRALPKPALIILDSYEYASDNQRLADWLTQQLLPEVETSLGLAVIVAGQKVPHFAMASWRDLTRQIVLQPITQVEPWREWVARHHPTFLESGYDLLTLIRASGGNPLVMASLCAATVRNQV
jgi:SEFIR domain